MAFDQYQRELFPHLITGNRNGAVEVFKKSFSEGNSAENFLGKTCWEILDQIELLWREDRIESLAYRYSTRTMRRVVDESARHIKKSDKKLGEMLVFCGPAESNDLCGQIISDLAEGQGWSVCFAGGGVASDEILQEVQKRKPQVLLLVAASASESPHHKRVIDSIKSNGACPSTKIAVCGGVFNRVPGLAEEIGIDTFESYPVELLEEIKCGSPKKQEVNAILGAA